ncbi:iron-containing alcohol dehydrogenase family protein [Cellulosilyticum sp. I15G10I2]|uniref:iron-containing alcohol dehydrogenase family protein n=1 Tax=Cellulosilyticum sp. I15G10I2 TaxID=1892843 RepID=UPI00085C643F|nr:iron-containing alcohol dehydrogenase family protein [Cellulosilyticum sp. I15G10I2]
MEFTYEMPTKVILGKGAVVKNKSEFAKYGQKALIVTGRNSAKKTGALDDVITALTEMHIGYVIFDEVEENPCTKTIETAAILGKREQVDFVIGIGGGSPLDASKAIGIMINNPGLTEETLFSSEVLESIPVLAVPTTSGTGSETTPYAILTDHSNQTKRNLGQKVFCKVAFLDAGYTERTPYDITVNTALDAMSHLVEGYLNTNSHFLSEMLAEKGLRLWSTCISHLLEGTLNFEIREKLMLASSIAGMVIASTGTSLPHGMGYPLTYFKGVPHGLANAVLFKAYLKSFKNRSKVESVFGLLSLGSEKDFDELLTKIIHCEISVENKEIENWSHTMCANAAKLKNHPEPVGYQDIYAIYYQSLNVKDK